MILWDRLEARLLASVSAGAEVDVDAEHDALDAKLEAPLGSGVEADPDRVEFELSMGLR